MVDMLMLLAAYTINAIQNYLDVPLYFGTVQFYINI